MCCLLCVHQTLMKEQTSRRRGPDIRTHKIKYLHPYGIRPRDLCTTAKASSGNLTSNSKSGFVSLLQKLEMPWYG